MDSSKYLSNILWSVTWMKLKLMWEFQSIQSYINLFYKKNEETERKNYWMYWITFCSNSKHYLFILTKVNMATYSSVGTRKWCTRLNYLS